MDRFRTSLPLLAGALLVSLTIRAGAQSLDGRFSGSIYILTTPEGADLPASASEVDFPLLVRLDKDFFDFSQARPHGEDVRFSSSDGAPLAHQIEEWDAIRGAASVWIRIPTIRGNARQEIKMHWGKDDAADASDGSAVFNASNGYLGVWHLEGALRDEVGKLPSHDTGTTDAAGVIGRCRHFGDGKGIQCGERITNYPSGSNPSTTEAWFRAEGVNSDIIAWGNEGGGSGSKVRMRFVSPPHIKVDSDFADVASSSRLELSRWIHVVHTYQNGDSRIYVDGRLDGATKPRLAIKESIRMWIGGWYDQYSFVGDIDEVRISRVARSADWIRLEYENQKPLQTLVGLLVRPGSDFSVAPAQLSVSEGGKTTFTARAGGAQKVYWILRKSGEEEIVAVDRFSFTFEAGRVMGNASVTLRFKAVYAGDVKIVDIPITIEEAIPEPRFVLKASAAWNGRDPMEVAPEISNLHELKAKGAGELHYRWRVSGGAVTQEIAPGKLILKRSQFSGKITVELALENGGAAVVATTAIMVTEPKSDPWVERTPGKDEKPEENQFFARDDQNQGTLRWNGVLEGSADEVFLRVYAGDRLHASGRQKPAADGSYTLSAKLAPGLVKYRAELGKKIGDRETLLLTAGNLVCGDAYLINGQSNAVATDIGEEDPKFGSDWIRSFGSMTGDPGGARLSSWGNAVCRDRDGEKLQIGYWGLELARRLVEEEKIPICILNGAVGGTRIDQHQRSGADPEDAATIYGRLLWRVRRAGLTHGIRGLIWHQGENDQGADGPTGGYGWETYQRYFLDLAAAWKEDYPNLQHYYVFQIWPKSCAMGVNGSDNMLREVQRTLPSLFSHMGIMSTLGVKPPGGCHFPPAGYAEFARLISPLIERDNYGRVFTVSITPPNLVKASFASEVRDSVVLEFDQPVAWNDSLSSQFHFEGKESKVVSGSVSGNIITLKLSKSTTSPTITYLESESWSERNLLLGENGIAALTFYRVPVLPPKQISGS